jgi:hypothetical protein
LTLEARGTARSRMIQAGHCAEVATSQVVGHVQPVLKSSFEPQRHRSGGLVSGGGNFLALALAQQRWVRGSAADWAYWVNEETMSSAMAQKLIERLSRWQRKA